MAFRYINPGLVSLLDSDCTATQLTGSQYSKTGVAFTQTNSSAGVTLPNFAEGDDFWARFDLYLPTTYPSYYSLYFFAPNTENYGLWFYFQGVSSTSIMAAYRRGSRGKDFATTLQTSGLKLGTINKILFHMVFGDENTAYMELNINGLQFEKTTGYAITYNASCSKVAVIYSSNTSCVLSNVIISDAEISPKEQVVVLPISTTATNMTAGASGIYLADAAGQILLQTPDVSTLIENYGASSAVTGIAVAGNPAYATGTGITTLTGLSISGDSVAEHGTCELSDDTTATAFDGWSTENLTLSDLRNMQFGWKAGE